jgi:hypothetical protein
MKLHFATLFIIIVFLMAACRPNTNNSTAQTVPTIPESSIPQWLFKTQEDTLGNPQTQIFLIAKDTLKITDATAPFTVVDKQEYKDKNLPHNTLTACSGFWAGLQQEFIVIDSSENWVIKAKYEDEGSEEPEDFQTIKVIKQ